MLTWLVILVMISSFPVGYLLAYLCRDELVDGRKWFMLIAGASLIVSLFVAFFNFSDKLSWILTLFYIAIISLISTWKSYDKKFLRVNK